MRELCDGDYAAPLKIEVWEAADGGGCSTLIGAARTDLSLLQGPDGACLRLTDHGKVRRQMFCMSPTVVLHICQLGSVSCSWTRAKAGFVRLFMRTSQCSLCHGVILSSDSQYALPMLMWLSLEHRHLSVVANAWSAEARASCFASRVVLINFCDTG